MSEQLTILFERTADGEPLPHELELQVEKLSWCAEGGPLQADLTAVVPRRWTGGGFPAGLLALLGQAVRVFNAAAEPVWWGYLARIDVEQGSLSVNLDLARLANRVAVQYWRRQAELEWQGEKTYTDWAEDARSICLYGVKERVLFLNSMIEEQAAAARDSWLMSASLPSSQVRTLPASHSTGADLLRLRLTCRGWWETIGWRYAHLFDGYEGFVHAAQQSQFFGRSINDASLAQSFQTSYGPWKCGEVLVKLRQYGFCTDSVSASICADDSGSPDTSSPLASQTVPASVINGGLRWVRFILPSPPLIQPNTPYWLVLQRSGALNTNNFYYLMREDTNPYPGGELKTWNGSSWVTVASGNADINFYLVGCKPRSERIEELVSAELGGQFLNGLRLQAEVEGNTLLWRDGTLTCLEELRRLLQTGDSSGRRLLAEVCADRSLLVRSEPEPSEAEYLIAADGSIRERCGAELSLASPAAGRRALLAPGWLDRSVLIWKAVWTPRTGLRAVLDGQ